MLCARYRAASRAMVTRPANASEDTIRTGPSAHLLSLTGTTPAAEAYEGAHSTQVPPLPLYEDLIQLRGSVITRCPFVPG